jgi:hypothetical protein
MAPSTAGGRGRRSLPGPTALTTLLLLLLSAALPAAVDLWPRPNPHLVFAASGSCPRCHVLRAGRVEPGRFLPGCDGYCLECHGGPSLGRTHPTGGRPDDHYRGKMTVPADFPLDDRGALMCLTCHTAHGPAWSSRRVHPGQGPDERWGKGVYRTLFLRRTGSKDGFAALCDECHRKL